MGGMNPDTLSGAAITVGRRTGQMEVRALGGPSYLAYTLHGFVYVSPALRDSARGLSFEPLGFPTPVPGPAHVGRAGVHLAYRDTNPLTGLTGWRSPAARLGRPHRVHSVKTAGHACTPRAVALRLSQERFCIASNCVVCV